MSKKESKLPSIFPYSNSTGKPKRAGAPKKQNAVTRIDPAELEGLRKKNCIIRLKLEHFNDAGINISHRLPIPPWDKDDNAKAQKILGRLLVASQELKFLDESLDEEKLGEFFGDLLRYKWSSAAWFELVVRDIRAMLKNIADPPHRNFLAFQAYVDFLSDRGHEPSRQGLCRFIKNNPKEYPVNLPDDTNDKAWWEMLECALLGFLDPSGEKLE